MRVEARRKAKSAPRVRFGEVFVTVVERWIDPAVHCHPDPYRSGVQGEVSFAPEKAAVDNHVAAEIEVEEEDVWLSLAKDDVWVSSAKEYRRTRKKKKNFLRKADFYYRRLV